MESVHPPFSKITRDERKLYYKATTEMARAKLADLLIWYRWCWDDNNQYVERCKTLLSHAEYYLKHGYHSLKEKSRDEYESFQWQYVQFVEDSAPKFNIAAQRKNMQWEQNADVARMISELVEVFGTSEMESV